MPTDTAAIDQEVEVRKAATARERILSETIMGDPLPQSSLSLNKPSLYQFHLSPEL